MILERLYQFLSGLSMIHIVLIFSTFHFVALEHLQSCSSSQTTCNNISEHSAELLDFLDLALIGTETQQQPFAAFNKLTGNIELIFSPCEPWNTCVGRCNQKTNLRINYPPYTCYCDTICALYDDCCVDYDHHCLKHSSNKTSIGFNNPRHLQFSCIDLNGKYGILMVDECDLKWKDDVESRFKCETEPIDPVTDHEGIVYKNAYCAVCNGINYDETVQVDLSSCKEGSACHYVSPKESKFQPRICVYDVGNCSVDFSFPQFQNLISKCQSYVGMVVAQKLGNQLKYKNPHCAICNNASKVTCPQWRWMINDLERVGHHDASPEPRPWALKLYGKHNKTPPIDEFQVKVVTKTSLLQTEIPPSVSVLFNFGLNGKKNFYFSSNQGLQGRNNDCPNDNIWDPFLDICRSLSCTAQFSLIDYQCVGTENNSTERDALSDLIFGINLSKVIVCLAFQIKSVTNSEDRNVIEGIMKNLPKSLAYTLGINTSRIANMTLLNNTYTAGQRVFKRSVHNDYANPCAPLLSAFDFKFRKNVAIRFELSEPEPQFEGFEPSIDRIISLLITNVNLNTMSLLLDGFTLRLLGIHEETVVDGDEFQNWCLDGEKRKYMNHEFTILNSSIIKDDWKMNIYVNATGKVYKKGEYLANFISIGKSRENDLTSVNGIVVVCENRSKLMSNFCPRLTLRKSEYQFIPNGVVNYTGKLPIGQTILVFGEYELTPDGNLSICYNVTYVFGLVVAFDRVQAYLGLVLMSISLFAMAITLYTYSLFSKLQNLPGMNLMNLVFILFLSQLTFLVGMRSSVTGLICKMFAIVIHYEMLSSFFWTNVMAYDLYKTFGNNNILPYMRKKKFYLKFYMVYAYLSPAVVVSIPIAIDACKCTGKFFVGYGDSLCWIKSPEAQILFFALPIAILLVINFIFYMITIYSIRNVTKTVKAATNKRGENDVNLYIRMSSVMGFTFIFVFAAHLTSKCCVAITDILTYLFVVTYSVQGLFIFWAFVCNKRVFNLYKPYWREMRIGVMNTLKKTRFFLPGKEKKITNSVSSFSSRSSSLQTSRSQLSDD